MYLASQARYRHTTSFRVHSTSVILTENLLEMLRELKNL